MSQKSFTCIVCPKSCTVTVNDTQGKLSVSGNECKRGAEYAQNEYLAPKRMITSTVKINGGNFARLGVIGTEEVPKNMLKECLREIYRITVDAPVTEGDIIIHHILGTQCDIIAAMSMDKK